MKYIVDNGEKLRLDVYLTEETDYTRSYIKQLIQGGHVFLNGVNDLKSGTIVKEYDEIELIVPEVVTTAEPRDIPIDIIYEDDDIAIINKRQGLTVHPAPGNYDNTLVNALLFRLKNLSAINGALRPGIVHRLDKNTSGVIAVAKNDKAHLSLSSQIANRSVTKIYLGLVDGHLRESSGRVNAPIGRSSRNRKLMSVTQDGRTAITDYEVVESFMAHDLVRFNILTGRTHQIRVHAKYLGHPIVGDEEYGSGSKYGTRGQLLHAYELTIKHPTSGEEMTFTAPLPDYFEKILSTLRKKEK